MSPNQCPDIIYSMCNHGNGEVTCCVVNISKENRGGARQQSIQRCHSLGTKLAAQLS